jgi:Peroxiredoxin
MVPDFSLPDCHGGLVDLQARLDRGPLVLLFVSAVASQDARRVLQIVQESLPAIDALGATAVAISAASPADIGAIVDELSLTFPVGHDSDSHVARLFGLTYEPPEPSEQWCRRIGMPTDSVAHGQPFVLPATYVINGDGTADYAVLEVDLRHRVRMPDLLQVLEILNVPR